MECDPENAVIASRRRIQSLMEQKRSVAYPWCVWSVHARACMHPSTPGWWEDKQVTKGLHCGLPLPLTPPGPYTHMVALEEDC